MCKLVKADILFGLPGFQPPGLEPNQHILRTFNHAWAEAQQPFRISKFKIGKYYHGNLPYWSPYDLLRLFFIVGRSNTNRCNFFLPLTAMVRPLVPPNWGRITFNCCWSITNDRPDKFALGASLHGCDWNEEQTGRSEYVCKRA